MLRLKIISALCLGALVFPGSVGILAHGQEATPAPAAAPVLKDLEFEVKLMSPISTKTSAHSDRFTAQVISPEAYRNAILEGKVTKVEKAKKGNGKSSILFDFETMTQGGQTTPILADLKQVSNSKGVKDVDEEGRAIGKSSNRKKVGGALGGAGLGALLGGLTGGARGAAIGAAAGAAAGFVFAVTLTSSGEDMEFAAGSQLTLVVSQPPEIVAFLRVTSGSATS